MSGDPPPWQDKVADPILGDGGAPVACEQATAAPALQRMQERGGQEGLSARLSHLFGEEDGVAGPGQAEHRAPPVQLLPRADLGPGRSRAHQLDWEGSNPNVRPGIAPGVRADPTLREAYAAHRDQQLAAQGTDVNTLRLSLRAAEALGMRDTAQRLRAEMFRAEQRAVVETLAVHRSDRYKPGSSTYCNIYAYDVVTALGGYLPRVWWTDSAIRRLQAGEQIQPEYGRTVHELNANALNAWMRRWGGTFGWRQAPDAATAQAEANNGRIVIILASNKNASRSGHVSVVMAEGAGHNAHTQDGQIVAPLQSQAGRNNFRYSDTHRSGGSQWWQNSSHKDGGFWVYDGPREGGLMTPDEAQDSSAPAATGGQGLRQPAPESNGTGAGGASPGPQGARGAGGRGRSEGARLADPARQEQAQDLDFSFEALFARLRHLFEGTAGQGSAGASVPEQGASDAPAPAVNPEGGEGAPWMAVAQGQIGVTEAAGEEDNEQVLEYHAATRLHARDDETPWCSAFVNWCMAQVGIQGTGSAAARSWLSWGERLSMPRPGCIVVFSRGAGKGHVGFYAGETATHIQVLGGNQSNRVCVKPYARGRLLGYRWPAAGADGQAVQRRDDGAAPDGPAVQRTAARGVAGAGSPMPHLAQIQRSFGRAHDLSGVQSFVGGQAREAAQQIGAAAYAMGDRVAFSQAPDLHTAAHEAAHVVQQRAGVQLYGGVGRAGDAYEQQADAVADRVVAGEPAEDLLPGPSPAGDAAGGEVQRREVNGPYHGNRPQPASSTDANYTLRSSASRVIKVGARVTYHIHQRHPSMQRAGSRTGIRWQIVNDPATARQNPRLPPLLEGPVDRWEWAGLQAQTPGQHTIRASMTLDGRPLADMSYQQQVVAASHSPVQPGPGVTPAPLSTMQDFIALVRRVETAYGGLPWQDVITRLRKEFYPRPGGAYSGIEAAFTWDDLIDEQQDLPGLESPPVALSDIAAVRRPRNQVVRTDGGEAVDIGHVLTGVDAMNFPGVEGTFARHDLEGPAAATWAGDVGSALVHFAVEAPYSAADDATKERFYRDYASASDLLGDVDALALADGQSVGLPPGAPLSQRLERYYQRARAQGQGRRYHNFCRASGFTVHAGRLDEASQQRIRAQVLRFAHAFNIKGSIIDGLILGSGNPASIELTTRARMDREVDWFSGRFIRWIEAGLAAEGDR